MHLNIPVVNINSLITQSLVAVGSIIYSDILIGSLSGQTPCKLRNEEDLAN